MKTVLGRTAAIVVAAQLAGCAGQADVLSMQGTSGAACCPLRWPSASRWPGSPS